MGRRYAVAMRARIHMQLQGRTRSLTLGGGAPLLNSANTPWAGPPLEVHRMQSVDVAAESGPLDGEQGMLVVVDGQVEVVRREGAREVSSVARSGSLSFVNGNRRAHIVRLRGSAEAVALHLSPDWLERLLLDEVPHSVDSLPSFTHDATVLSLTCAMRDEVARGASTGRLYAESLSLALLSYAMHRAPPSSHMSSFGLADEQRRRLRTYILDHLAEDISLSELAALVGRRPRRFSTLFREAFGTTPHRYVMAARLAEGARLLADGSAVAEVALRVGFCSQSHFADAFRRTYGVTPRRYALDKRTTRGVSRPELDGALPYPGRSER